MKTAHKRLLIGFASVGAADLGGFITMFANPDLTERVIPALFGVQVLGFVAIAAIIVTNKREFIPAERVNFGSGPTLRRWVPWLFGLLALLSFLRVLLALLYIAGEEGHRHSWFSAIAGTAMGCFFLSLAIWAGRSASRTETKEANEPNPGA